MSRNISLKEAFNMAGKTLVSNKLRSSVGIAANVWTPVGPLSWTFSQDIAKATSDKTESVNFRLGTSF